MSTEPQISVQHRLASVGFIVLPGQEEAFIHLEDQLRSELQPSGGLQNVLFTRILECSWNLRRCRLAEAQLSLGHETDPLLDDALAAKSERIQKYARAAQNSLAKALRELAKIQTELQYRAEAYPLTQEQIDDPELFHQTPHALSEVIDFRKIMTSVIRQDKSLSETRRKDLGAKSAAFIAEMKAASELDDLPFEAAA